MPAFGSHLDLCSGGKRKDAKRQSWTRSVIGMCRMLSSPSLLFSTSLLGNNGRLEGGREAVRERERRRERDGVT